MPRLPSKILVGVFAIAVAAPFVPATAQIQQPRVPLPAPQEARQPAVDPARTATIGNTQVGQRQVDPLVDADLPNPNARIANRIQNRVQNRLSNRIDPSYRPRTAVADPFKAATAEPETAKKRGPR